MFYNQGNNLGRGYFYMKAAVFAKAGQMKVEDIAKPTIKAPDDVLIKVVRACVCGSDYGHIVV